MSNKVPASEMMAVIIQRQTKTRLLSIRQSHPVSPAAIPMMPAKFMAGDKCAAVKCGTLHQAADGLEIINGPFCSHTSTLHCKALIASGKMRPLFCPRVNPRALPTRCQSTDSGILLLSTDLVCGGDLMTVTLRSCIQIIRNNCDAPVFTRARWRSASTLIGASVPSEHAEAFRHPWNQCLRQK